jgi:hypothetical protein
MRKTSANHMVPSCPLVNVCCCLCQTDLRCRARLRPEAPVHGHKHARETRSQQHHITSPYSDRCREPHPVKNRSSRVTLSAFSLSLFLSFSQCLSVYLSLSVCVCVSMFLCFSVHFSLQLLHQSCSLYNCWIPDEVASYDSHTAPEFNTFRSLCQLLGLQTPNFSWRWPASSSASSKCWTRLVRISPDLARLAMRYALIPEHICDNQNKPAFACLRGDGKATSWGDAYEGGDSASVQALWKVSPPLVGLRRRHKCR